MTSSNHAMMNPRAIRCVLESSKFLALLKVVNQGEYGLEEDLY